MKKLLAVTLALTLSFSSQVSAHQSMDEIAKDYVFLVLALGEHDGGYVDAYYGPKNWREQVKQNGWSKDKIIKKAQKLQASLPKAKSAEAQIDQLRIHYLHKQLTALMAHAKALKGGGNKMSFDEQSELLYDTQAPHHQLSDFDAALAEIDKLLPGQGSLPQRMEAFRKQFEIPADKLDKVFQRALQECRDRTKDYIALLDKENFTLEYVKDKPWGGYNWYQGDAHSLIQINTDFPTAISRAIDLGCHEGYPGHHTYNALLENNLVKDRGWMEYSVYPLYSPQSLIAEGSANYGIYMAFPGKEKAKFEKEVLFPLAGLNPKLADDYEKLNKLIAKVGYAGNEVARMYIDGKIDREKAIELSQKYSMMNRARAEQRLSFIDGYGAYVINYNWGRDIVKEYIEKAKTDKERWERFSQLLSSPRIPSSLNW